MSRLDFRYTRKEPGWQQAHVYGLEVRALHFDLVRAMDEPGWRIEAMTLPNGRGDQWLAEQFLEKVALLRGSTLGDLKARLEESARNWWLYQ